jgi:hypothetical protein
MHERKRSNLERFESWIFPSDGLLRAVRRLEPTFKDYLSDSTFDLKMEPIGSPETSVRNHLKPRNNP